MNSRSHLEIDLSKLESNYRKISALVYPANIICVLKANAYGMGVKAYAEELYRLGCRNFGVADAAEAKELAAILGKSKSVSIQILSSILPEEIPGMVSDGVVLPIVDVQSAKLISAAAVAVGGKARVHFKLDTGMGRLGVRFENAIETLKKISKFPNLILEGVFSHFPNATKRGGSFTKTQVERFEDFLNSAKKEGFIFKKIHIAASDAINNFPVTSREPFNFVRVGLNLHGAFNEQARKHGIESVVQFKSKIVQVRMLSEGVGIGYNSTFKLDKDSKIAVVAAGYADGVPLQLSNKGHVLVKGQFCPIVGRVSMDYTTIDVAQVKNVKPGDEVVLIGGSNGKEIFLDQWAQLKRTHAYEILTSFGNRVERVLFRSR
jgi:alanine racemase